MLKNRSALDEVKKYKTIQKIENTKIQKYQLFTNFYNKFIIKKLVNRHRFFNDAKSC